MTKTKINRRNFLKSASLAATVYALGCNAETNRIAKPQKRPNILFIDVDDMGWDTPGCYGNKTPEISPRIDRLALEGLKFMHGYVTVAICQPSRTVWNTGKYPHRNGTIGFNAPHEGITTVGMQLRDNGYFTGIMGKSTHYQPLDNRSWDFYISHMPQWARGPASYGEKFRTLLDSAKDSGKPFFAIVDTGDPHRPFSKSQHEMNFMGDSLPPDPSRIYKPSEVDVPGYLYDTPEVRQELAYYYNSCKRGDDVVGVILDALEEYGLADDTIVMFVSDNGAPLPFAKGNVYRASCRTPWIVRWPSVIEPGTVDNTHHISGIDLMPTVLDLAGAPIPEDVDGRSFAPVLKGKKQPDRDKVHVVFHRGHSSHFESRAIHTAEFGYIYNEWAAYEKGRKQFVADNNIGIYFNAAKKNPEIQARVDFYFNRAPEELYDYRNDPWALKNLADDPAYHDKLEEMRHLMIKWKLDTHDYIVSGYNSYIGRQKSKAQVNLGF